MPGAKRSSLSRATVRVCSKAARRSTPPGFRLPKDSRRSTTSMPPASAMITWVGMHAEGGRRRRHRRRGEGRPRERAYDAQQHAVDSPHGRRGSVWVRNCPSLAAAAAKTRTRNTRCKGGDVAVVWWRWMEQFRHGGCWSRVGGFWGGEFPVAVFPDADCLFGLSPEGREDCGLPFRRGRRREGSAQI